jgi:hypothetical protein
MPVYRRQPSSIPGLSPVVRKVGDSPDQFCDSPGTIYERTLGGKLCVRRDDNDSVTSLVSTSLVWEDSDANSIVTENHRNDGYVINVIILTLIYNTLCIY